MTARASTLGEREQRLASALDLARDALVVLGPEGLVECVNRAAERLLGIDRRAVIGCTVFELFEGTIGVEYELDRGTTAGIPFATLRLGRIRPSQFPAADVVPRPVMYDSREDERREAPHPDSRFLEELDTVLSHRDEPARILQQAGTHIARYLDLDRCLFCDIFVDSNELVIHPGYERRPPSLAGTVPLDAFGPQTREWLLAGRIVVTSDTRTDPRTSHRYQTAYEPIAVRATLAVPMMQGDRCVGCVSAASEAPRSWTAREISLLHAAATRTWLFIEHGRAMRMHEHLVDQLRTVNTDLERRVAAHTAELTRALSEREALLAERDETAEQLRLDIEQRVATEAALRENEARYRRLFHDSPTALCEQDFSAVRAYLNELIAGGVTDVVAHLRKHPQTVAAAARRVRFVEVNDATLEVYEAESRAEILANWHKLFDQDMLKVFVEELCFLVEGKGSTFAARAATRTLKGRRNEIAFRLTVLPGSEHTWERLVASIFDMTAYYDAERKLQSALREKDVLLKEVHHRVKNNLQVISSLLSLQAQYVSDDSARAVFASSQGRVQSIALVHEKLYQSRDLSHIRLAEYIETLTGDLLRAHSAAERGISSIVEVADLSLPVDVAIPCGLIVNELVSNALKHAFTTATSGTVRVRALRPSPDFIELSVTDDGSGLPQGVDPGETGSLGLDLVFTFAEQLGAEVEITRKHGTTFVFRFKDEAA
jgi:two-component sensor histidine kinase/GAF domain-containing protein